MKDDPLCPPGSVTVNCSYPGCTTSWWLGKDDPRLAKPEELLCGADHSKMGVWDTMQLYLARLRIQQGLRYTTISAHPTHRTEETGCGRYNHDKGVVEFADRTSKQRALFAYEDITELLMLTPDKLSWEAKEPALWASAEEGMTFVDPYCVYPDEHFRPETREKRKHLMSPCPRCGHFLHLDSKDPLFKAGPVTTLGEGRPDVFEQVPRPSWYGTIPCEAVGWDSLFGPPCYIMQGPAKKLLDDMEQLGRKWTVWTRTKTIFFNQATNEVGIAVHNGNVHFLDDGMLEIEWMPYKLDMSVRNLTGDQW